MQVFYHYQTTFVGVDPTAGKRPFAYAALDHELKLLALGHGSIDDVLAFLAGQRQAFVAVSAPRRPNLQLLDRSEVRASLSPPPKPGRWFDFRLCEYLLRQHNISTPQTSSSVEKCPNWMKVGFHFYSRLEGMGYRPYPDEECPLQYMEVYPHACFTTLLGLIPFPKNSLEGRLQRQLILHELKINVRDAMEVFEEITRYRLLNGILPTDHMYKPAELDALVSAYTAWLAALQPDQVLRIGDREEGELVLPVAELKARYEAKKN